MEESSQAFDLEQISNNIQTLCESFNTQPTNITWNQLRNYFEIKNITIDSLGIYQFGYALPLCFTNCIFNCEIRDTRGLSLPIKQPISFLNCTFKKDVLIFNFYFDIVVIFNCVFESKCYFDSSVFNKFANFGETTFNYVSFEGSKFNDDVSFYGATFQQPPNFSQVRFKGSLNAVNTEMLFQEQDLKNTIKKAKEKYDTESNVDKSLIYFINDFRDSFRNLKNALIKDNNLLDASNFHKYELYSKEIELDSKKTKTLKDKVEKWQLWFYRKLCDHHTDILQSFHSLMLVIGLFGLTGFGVIIGFNYYYLGYKPFSHLYMAKEIYDAHIHSFIKTHTLYTFLFNISILAFYLFMLIISILIISIECIPRGFFICIWKILRGFFIGIWKIPRGCFICIWKIIKRFFICIWKILRGFFIVVSYVSYAVVIGILLVSPKILIPAMGIFTDKRALLDPLSTLGGIYTIIFGFVLFSFIKTIRKNSIVPN